MGLNIEYLEGQTPLDEDEKEDLIIRTISNRGELDEFEQANIQQAIEWTMNWYKKTLPEQANFSFQQIKDYFAL